MTAQPQRSSRRVYLLVLLLIVSAWLVYRLWPRDLGKEFRRAVYQRDQVKVERMLAAHPELVKLANTPPLTPKMMPQQSRAPTMNFMEEFTVFLWDKVVMKPVVDDEKEEEFQQIEEECLPPLLIALAVEDLGMSRLLLQQGADIKQTSRNGMHAIYMVARSTPDFARLLLENGADVRASNYYSHTPLHFAVHNPHVETVELLLKAGADPNAQNRAGNTPFHNAIYARDTNIWLRLLHYGARLDITNRMGRTPVEYAREHHLTNAIEFFSARQPGPAAPP